MKYVPNTITFFRIVLSIVLLAIESLSPPFLIIYSFCGLSDILDGYIARKMSISSNFGAKMDSIADMILIIAMFIKLLPMLKVQSYIVIWIGIIFIIRISSIVTVILKYQTFAVLHTYLNKATGITLFCIPLLLSFIDIGIFDWVVCIVATLSAVEEMVIHVTSKKLDINTSGIFAK